ncbi:MAG: hydroxyacid dehydrogenase, partial [Planctomycetota bacterium]|nr:hydroxyacid dehydrogenase [Planctomycetota bacterium]
MPCWHFSESNRQRLQAALPEAEIAVCSDREAFFRALSHAEVAIIWRFQQEWFAFAPRLRLLATPAAGRDYFSVTPPPGVRLFYGSFHGEIMGETVLAMMLGHCRGIIASDRLMRTHAWPQAELATAMKPLRGSHVAILGFGHIG